MSRPTIWIPTAKSGWRKGWIPSPERCCSSPMTGILSIGWPIGSGRSTGEGSAFLRAITKRIEKSAEKPRHPQMLPPPPAPLSATETGKNGPKNENSETCGGRRLDWKKRFDLWKRKKSGYRKSFARRRFTATPKKASLGSGVWMNWKERSRKKRNAGWRLRNNTVTRKGGLFFWFFRGFHKPSENGILLK